MTMHEELELARELDQALRTAVTTVAQITERTARTRADKNRELAQREREAARETASHARELQRQQEAKNRAVWTAQRDGARDRFLPWTRPGVVERGDRVAASRAWAAAAAWADQDPRALAARDDLGRRIETAHGADPATILRSVENPSAPGRVPAGRITMPEAVDLAEAHAPFYYRRHSNLRGRLDARPNGAAQQQVWADWQHWAEYGRLPTLSRWEAWAEHTGRGAEFAPDRWRVAGGAVDEHARAAALHRHWETTATDRADAELDHHRAQMRAAGLDPNRADLAIGTSLTPAGRPDRPLDPNALDDAAVADLVRTWESARVTAILEPDNAATALDNADLLERHFRDRFGIDPATYLADALQDTAAAAADAARDQDAVATALSEETAIAHDISASTATGAPVEIRYRDVVLPAGPDNPDRGVAPTKAGSDAERAHRAQAWRLAQAGMDETAWKALPSKDRYDRYWTVYDAQEARQVQIPENGTLGPAAPLTSASEDSAKTPQPERTAPAAAADPRQLAIDAIENLWPHDAEWIIASQTRSVDQLGDRLQEAAEKGYEPLEIMREAVISSGTERLMQPNSAPGDTVDTSAGNRYPPGVTHPGTIGTDPAKFAARQIRRELDNRGTASTAAKDPTPERTKPAAPTSATGSQAPAAPSARPSVAPKEERGMAPSKASTPQERARRATAWALAEQSFRAELPADTSSMAAGKAWQEMAWQDKALRYWTAYDSAEARTAAGLEPVAAPQTAPPRRTAPAPNETPAISRERTIELNTLAADYFATSMTPDSPGYAYLAGRLGADVVADDRWRFGYAPTGWSNLTGHLRSHGATDTEIVAAGLGRQSTRGQVIDFFRDRAMVGIRDQDGDIVGFIGRDLSGDERAPKYLNTGSTPAYTKGDHLLGLYEAPDSARLARVEGPFDAVAVTAAGDGQVAGVAPLGTALTDRQADQLAERGRIWEMLDADAAGRTAAEKDFWLLAERGVDVRDIPLPDGLDPAKMWEDKRDDLRARLADLDNARSGAFLVIDNAIAELRPRLIAGDDDAAAEIGFTEHRVREHAPEDQRDQLLSYSVDEVAQLQYDAGQEAVEQVLSEMRATEGELDQAQSIIDDERATAVQPGDRDSGPDRTEARPASANYDRAESVPETIDDDARQARTVSAYGYPRSTRDMLAETDNRKATQAKPRPQTPGSGRATHIRSQRR
ncbi:toprim domain-containing protein [Amycolatopsis sp. A1MSW2902]|uniref:toprim domain-containing protein n=1 Tax=Amycolatopsis sp. A1MSW2902 TaxID=687413 RepID=UPI00307EDFEF